MRRSPGLGVLVPGFRQRGHPDPRRSERGVDDTAALVVELRSSGDESDEKLPWYVARGVAEILVVDPPTRRFELYRTDAGTAMVVTPGDDGGVTLDTLGLHLITVVTSDGPRLRVITDTDSTEC
jgi:hypothetical protein